MLNKAAASGVVFLKRSQLHPHPDNPRKELGDLTELKESIREHGIMQNLTVIPIDDEWDNFRILIGHRRFAASEGLAIDLPCVIVEGLSDKEQIGIMLCENMQRSDLTFMEQAYGFQMMMDFGEDIGVISKKTGFSENTIKHRLEIAKLDKNLIDKVQEENHWQMSIGDFMELEKIKDLEDRSLILEDSQDSNDLYANIEQYLREQAQDENYAKYVKLFDEFGWKESKDKWITYNSNYELLVKTPIDLSEKFDPEPIRKIASKTKGEILFARPYGNSIRIVKKVSRSKEKKQKSPEELERERIAANANKLEEIRANICDEYYRCIENIPNKTLTSMKYDDSMDLIKTLWELMERCEDGIVTNFEYRNVLGIACDAEDLDKIYRGLPIVKRMMLQVWCSLADKWRHKLCEYNGCQDKETIHLHIDFIDDVLYHFGLRLSDEYDEILWGESDLFEPEVKADGE